MTTMQVFDKNKVFSSENSRPSGLRYLQKMGGYVIIYKLRQHYRV